MDLVLLSGGPDSAFALEWALSRTDAPIATLFVGQRTPASMPERVAAAAIAEHLGRKYRPVLHHVLTMAWPNNLPPHYNVTLAYASAGLIFQLGGVRRIYRGDSREEQLGTRPEWEGMNLSGEAVFNHCLGGLLSVPGADRMAGAPVRMPEVLLPGKPHSKRQYIREMDDVLKGLVWSCQSPRMKAGRAFPCGECEKCEIVEEARL